MEITDQVISDFREWHEAFSDTTVWSNPSVLKALIEGEYFTASKRWGSYLFNLDSSKGEVKVTTKAKGLFAYAGHILLINNASNLTVKSGQIASAIAPVSSKSVASESVGFARSSGRPNSNGFDDLLGSTSYGQMFIGYREDVSQGPIIV